MLVTRGKFSVFGYIKVLRTKFFKILFFMKNIESLETNPSFYQNFKEFLNETGVFSN